MTSEPLTKPVAVDSDALRTAETERPSQIIFRAQTSEEEFEYLLWVLGQMPFYKANNYSIALPEHPAFQELAQASSLEGVDREKLKLLFVAEIYNPTFFGRGLENLESARNRIESALPVYSEFNQLWGFELFEKYEPSAG